LLHEHPFDTLGLDLGNAAKGACQPAAERRRPNARLRGVHRNAPAAEAPAQIHGYEGRVAPDD
jgi:hypothetical protein